MYQTDNDTLISMARLRNNKDFQHVVKWLEYVQGIEMCKCVAERNPVDIHRAQGAAECIQSLLTQFSDAASIVSARRDLAGRMESGTSMF